MSSIDPAHLASRTGAALRYLWPFLAAFGLVKALQLLLYPTPYLIADTGEFLESAGSLQPNPYKPIGYSWFLAACRPMAAVPLGVVIIQSALRLGATVVLALALRGHRWPRWAVLGVSTLVGCDLQALLLDHYLLSDSLFTTLTVTFTGLVLVYARDRSRAAWVGALLVSLAAVTVRFVGLICPVVLMGVVAVVGGPGGWRRVVVTAVATGVVVLALSAQIWRQFGVFRYTTFDGWAFYGNAAALLDLDPAAIDRIDDEETRLVYEYLASFPAHEALGANPNWYRWSPRSPAKQLLSVFWSAHPRTDPASVRRSRRFLGRFMAMADSPTTDVQRLYHRLRSHDPEAPPYFMEYREAYVFTNELLRLVNREFMRRHADRYLTDFYPGSIAAAIVPLPVQNEGRYTLREEADQSVSRIWPGVDTTTWRPRYGDVLAPVFAAYRVLVPVVWILAAVAIGWGLGRRRSGREAAGMGIGLWTLLVAVIYVAAVAFSHRTETRYLAPIMPVVVVGAAMVALDRGPGGGAQGDPLSKQGGSRGGSIAG